MKYTRRHFLSSITLATAASLTGSRSFGAEASAEGSLDQVLAEPVLKTGLVGRPVIIESIELLRSDGQFLLRTRSKDGVEAITVPNQHKIGLAVPVLLKNVIPVFIGKDARNLEKLLWEVYRHNSNYKMQGLLFWIAVAAVEMGALELLSKTAERPLADLFGGTRQRDIPVYFASGNRGNEPAAEIDFLKKLISKSGAKAIKWRAGGRMSRNADSLPGRTEKLIPLVRESFDDEITVYADANSSYDAPEAIRIGRMMEENGYGFFEEPCEFDDLVGTKQTADALTIPVAGGEQEFSMQRWKWLIANRAVDIVQPDLHYGGGLIRATKVARMAASAGLTVVPHMSGGGLGYVEIIQFASFTPNIGPHMEFKGNTSLPVEAEGSTLECRDGIVRCPDGIGFGVNFDPGFLRKAVQVE